MYFKVNVVTSQYESVVVVQMSICKAQCLTIISALSPHHSSSFPPLEKHQHNIYMILSIQKTSKTEKELHHPELK